MKQSVITIKDVARLAGVGIGTASYALNGTKTNKVSDATRQRVLDVAEKLHYKTNTFGRVLKMRNSRLIGVMLPTMVHEVLPVFIQGIQDELAKNNYSMLFHTYSDRHDLENKCQTFLNWRVEGIIFNPQSVKDQPWFYEYFQKLAANIPIVAGGGVSQDFFPHVLVDGEAIGRMGTEYLISKGHRRIALINDLDNWRTKGYLLTLKKANITPNYDYIYNDYEAMYDERKGFFHWLEHFPPKKRPTAVFCLSETMAAKLIAQAQDRNYVLPKTLSVLGTDNSELSNFLRPRLTTIFQSHYLQGVESVRLLLRILAKQDKSNVLLQPELIERDSVFDFTVQA